ncbi:MAG: dihydrodipicolinate synthase family protein [Anaerolineae bacterium]|nr:dihydrodipicolinate synthase family protein [Anaerolineae bacterium]
MSDRMKANLRGVIPILATPFTEDNEVDKEDARRLIEHLLAQGVHGVAATGGSGEVRMLTRAEREWLVSLAMEQIAGRVPVLVGVSAPTTEEAVHHARYASRAGAAGVFGVVPDSALGDEEAMFQHYRAIAAVVECPVFIQDTDQQQVPISLIVRAARELPPVRYVKEETRLVQHKISAILAACEDRLQVVSGAGGTTILAELRRGAVGVMPGSVYAGPLAKIYDLYQAGELAAARAEYYRILPLIVWRSPMYLAGMKEVLYRQGIFKTSLVREPSPALDDLDREELTAILDSIGEPY